MLSSLKNRIALALTLAVLVVGGSALWVLEYQAQRSTEQLEVALSSSGMQRLALLFESQTQVTRGVLRTWAHWTELYAFVQAPGGTFAADELSIEAVEVTGMHWMVLLDTQRRVLVTAERPLGDDATPMTRELTSRPQLLLALARHGVSAEGCGAVRAGGRIGLTCYAPVLPSSGVGEPAGVLVMGRWLDAEFMQHVSAQLGMPFSVEVLRPEDSPPWSRYVPGSLFSREPFTIEPDGPLLRVSQPLYSLYGWQVARLELQWPRHTLQDTTKRLEQRRWLVVLLISFSGLMVWLLVHQWIIAPLAQLRRAMQDTLSQRQWSNTLDTGRTDEIGTLTRTIDDLLGVVRRQVDELQQLSLTDPLTGLPNRRAFNERLRFMLVQHERHGTPSTFMLVDVDHFKAYNDAYGHQAGDQALVRLADKLRSVTRAELDLPARLGGEEFALLVQGMAADLALQLAQRLQAALAADPIVHCGNPPYGQCTISIGLAQLRQGDTPDSVYRRADLALYDAKAQGRNRAVVG